jgi:hypothetical protein
VNGYTKRRWIVAVILAVALTGVTGNQVFAQAIADREYFPEKGHWVTGEFLKKYYSIPNPQELFGDPITDAFIEDISGLKVQYFEKARFELHPEEIPDLRVKLSNLGSYLYQKGQTLPVLYNASGCRFYPQVADGYHICYDFLEFFDENGGIAHFGYPISNFEILDGWIVQHFQRARLEWHPENPLGKSVMVSNIGKEYFIEHNENLILLNPIDHDNIIPQPITNITVRAFVETPVMPFNGTQTLYVIVQDQNHDPVEGTDVKVSILYPDGEVQPIEIRPTNARGISIQKFPVHVDSPGIIEVQVTGTLEPFQEDTKTSFQVWW